MPTDTVTYAEDLDDYEVVRLVDAEGEQLRETRELFGTDAIAPRIRQLIKHGWKVTDLADLVGVTRVTLSKWAKADGETSTDSVLDLRPPSKRLADVGYTMRRVNLRVPDALVVPLQALWRVAYTHRFSTAETQDSRTVSDALDLTISMLLRRGITYYAIAEAAGVTHRAVLDRMRRAGEKCRVFCETEQFVGSNATLHESLDEWLPTTSNLVVTQSTTSQKTGAARLRVSVMFDVYGKPVVDLGVGFRPPELGHCATIASERQFVPWLTAPASISGTWRVSVPEQLLYVPGWWTMNQDVKDYFPAKYWDEFFSPFELVTTAMAAPKAVFADYDKIQKFGARKS